MRLLSSLLLSSILLAGCAGVQPKPEAPNADLLMDCPTPTVQAKTNGQLASTLLAYRDALKNCNDDKAALREFYKDTHDVQDRNPNRK